ncbi:MAG TPA: hypothetical protein VGD14_13880 [bacterium]
MARLQLSFFAPNIRVIAKMSGYNFGGIVKRLRAPKTKPGELKAQWGRISGDSPDLCYSWGDGCSKSDGHLIHNVFTSDRPHSYDAEKEPSFIKDLEDRGYDITTLKFYIRKKFITPS